MPIVADLSGNNPGNPNTNGWDGTDDHNATTKELQREYYAAGTASDFWQETMLLATAAASRTALGTNDAANITTGTLDTARIPAIASAIQVISASATIAGLSVGEQSQIVAGAVVTTTDGKRYVYDGTGSKTDSANYIELADVTPDWSVISNKPNAAATVTELTNDQTGTEGVSTDYAREDHAHPFPTASINAQTGTTYTLQSSDHGKIVELTNAVAITLTVPNTLPIGFNCGIYQGGAGQVTITGSSITLRNRSSHTKLSGQYAEGAIRVRSASEFVLAGDTAA